MSVKLTKMFDAGSIPILEIVYSYSIPLTSGLDIKKEVVSRANVNVRDTSDIFS